MIANLTLDGGAFRKYLGDLERRRDNVGIGRGQAHGLAYTLTVHAVSDLEMAVTASQTSHSPGSNAVIRAVLTDSGIPLERQVYVAVDVAAPDGSAATVALMEVEPGVHETILPLRQAGLYPLMVCAIGQAFSGQRFTREELRTVAVWTDPVRPPAGGDTDHGNWCELLLCLLQDETAGKALAERGVNVDGLRDCIRRFCDREG